MDVVAFAVYVGAVFVIVGVMLGLSYLLSERHEEHATNEPYESGVRGTGSARVRYSAQFYRVAMFFVIFDLEAVFIFAWAVSAREVGWLGYIEISIFITILLAALVYLWRLGALDWGTLARQKQKRRGQRITRTDGLEQAAVREV